ncbi:uncharacterized protein SPPG_02626 [Spizellomyces punctatus DAOM BR117]|uniref:Uncharacterized protein n=1 Tax=Spizellomyces punctatus (strain DAOM BR117) TaxID=645134 RepID=A0A0L0HM08_SPIPD|nr:uncharacterized protein SPPG_02626 [Spizellomyces punctatus DAOM BR117]KND02132.1 hypothetical protein SPPG_02626 [Spizellomyces punctatus DAOM BR117]|eukprot:XP_016610171.1 hypothetical protein SPPG_02626 [Spizellomyces punctatus DAOM BR117]
MASEPTPTFSGFFSLASIQSICPSTPVQYGDVAHQRLQSQLRLKMAWESIYEKYGQEFHDADEIDLEKEEIVVDKGWVRNHGVHVFGKVFYQSEDAELRSDDTGLDTDRAFETPARVQVAARHMSRKRKTILDDCAMTSVKKTKCGPIVARIYTLPADDKAAQKLLYDDEAFDNLLPQHPSTAPCTPFRTLKPTGRLLKGHKTASRVPRRGTPSLAINALATPVRSRVASVLADLDLNADLDLLTTPHKTLESEASRLEKVRLSPGKKDMQLPSEEAKQGKDENGIFVRVSRGKAAARPRKWLAIKETGDVDDVVIVKVTPGKKRGVCLSAIKPDTDAKPEQFPSPACSIHMSASD